MLEPKDLTELIAKTNLAIVIDKTIRKPIRDSVKVKGNKKAAISKPSLVVAHSWRIVARHCKTYQVSSHHRTHHLRISKGLDRSQLAKKLMR